MTVETDKDHLRTLDSAEVKKLFHMSDSTLWRHVKSGQFPTPFYLGRNALWHISTIENWLSKEHGVEFSSAKAAPPKRDLSEFA